MKEIKVRAWTGSAYLYDVVPIFASNHIIESHPLAGFKLREVECFELYTGLKDKNGVDIYEGDVVKDQWKNIHEIVFEDGSFYAKNKDPEESINPYHEEAIIKVIGNIYENPELI